MGAEAGRAVTRAFVEAGTVTRTAGADEGVEERAVEMDFKGNDDDDDDDDDEDGGGGGMEDFLLAAAADDDDDDDDDVNRAEDAVDALEEGSSLAFAWVLAAFSFCFVRSFC